MPLLSREHADHYERLTRLVEAGQLHAVLDLTHPLGQAADAMRHLERGDVRGKVAIVV